MKQRSLSELKREIQLEAKNGVDFIIAAAIVWEGIFVIWTLGYTAYDRSVLTFIFGAVLLPLAFGLSKVFKTNWKIKDNPLQPLGLWLNFAQLIYFPFLVFMLIKDPNYFIMAYAIITGAHLFPYAWFYDEIGYAVASVVISVGALMVTLFVGAEKIYLVPLFTGGALLVLGVWIYLNYRRRKKSNG